jgi:hypothetical protein
LLDTPRISWGVCQHSNRASDDELLLPTSRLEYGNCEKKGQGRFTALVMMFSYSKYNSMVSKFSFLFISSNTDYTENNHSKILCHINSLYKFFFLETEIFGASHACNSRSKGPFIHKNQNLIRLLVFHRAPSTPKYCHDLELTIGALPDWWMTTYTQHSELQSLKTLSLIPTSYKSVHTKSSPACSVFTSHCLVTALDNGDSSASVLTSLLSGEYPTH